MADTGSINIAHGDLGSEPPSRPASSPIPDVLPILGLSDIVIFPGMTAPLLVESAQSIRLVDDVVAGDRLVALVLQKKAEAENPRPEELHKQGCLARVVKMLKFPDNTVRILVEGLRRLHIGEYVELEPYLKARVTVIKDDLEESLEVSAMTRNASGLLEQVFQLSPAISEQIKVAAMNSEDPGKLTDLIGAHLNFSLEERQRLIETSSIRERLQQLLPLLQRELEVLTLGSKIQNEVVSTLSKSQRDFFLREQIRAIQRELGEPDPAASELASLREKIEKNGLSDDARTVALKELDRLQQTSPATAEYTVARTYVDWLIHLPWSRETEDQLDLARAEKILDDHHFGLGKVKDRLLEFLAVIKLRKQLKGPILCLVGPPGVGKTSLGQSVADTLGRKFARIALGGLHDEAEIRGHRRTYVGAMPGRIIQAIRRIDSRNPVILLDEIDKIGSDFRGDPAAALLEVLDPAQNHTFTDHYLDVPFDLSRVLFITTANWLDPIHAALRDRLEVIELPSYIASEKLQIAKRHLVPRQLDEHGLKRKSLRLPDATIRSLIENYTREAGVRNLEREIASLTRKAARRIVTGKPRGKTLVISPGDLKEYLGTPRFPAEAPEKLVEPGIAIGLAWTPVGGEVLFIEATSMAGHGSLLLTGSLGDVMKESAQAALSFLRSQARVLSLDVQQLRKKDIHVHVPAGATPKDGPSAGVTMAVALASVLTGRCVRSELAMTGEISLRGRVLRVGGIKEKLLAAVRYGLKEVILPTQNRPDWEETPVEVRQKLKVRFVDHISEALKIALRPPGGRNSA